VVRRLDEDPRSRTEPDVLLYLGESGVILIELKHRGSTDVKGPNYGGWDRYFPAESPLPFAASVRASGCHELARNWRFGLGLAVDPARPCTRVCLGTESLFVGKSADILRPFEECLPRDGSARFQTLTWDSRLGTIG
jgi:hypothetical protein